MTEHRLAVGAPLVYSIPMQEKRKETARAVLKAPENFKVCEVCGCIATHNTSTCPDCYAYRFNTDPNFVANKAIDLGAKAPNRLSHYEHFEDSAE